MRRAPRSELLLPPKCQSPSGWQAIFVIAEDFIGWPGIEYRETPDGDAELCEFGTDSGTAAWQLMSVQPFPKGANYRFGETLSGKRRELPGKPIRLVVLDAECHLSRILALTGMDRGRRYRLRRQHRKLWKDVEISGIERVNSVNSIGLHGGDDLQV